MSFRAVADGEKSLKSSIFTFGFRDFSAFGLEMTCIASWKLGIRLDRFY